MKLRPTADDLDGTATPPDSELSDELSDDSIARELALIMERLAVLESRFEQLEERVEKAGRPGQGSPSGTTASVINSPPPTTPVTSRRRRIGRSTKLSSPTQHSSAHTTRLGESQPSSQPLSQVAHRSQGINSLEDISASPKKRGPLPVHYFTPYPILTPDQFALEMQHAREGPYFVVTQGLNLGAFRKWPIVAAVAKNVNGIWRKAESKEQAVEIYRDAYNKGLCKLFDNV